MISAEIKSCSTFSPRPCWLKRDTCSWQMKFGSFCENWNAASLARSIKGAEAGSEGLATGCSGLDSVGGGSGHGGKGGCVPRVNVGGPSEQGGVLDVCDCVACGGVGS